MQNGCEKYQDGLFYQIRSCAKYFDLLFENMFKELNFGISALEHLALSVIFETKDCCQRDLAKIILKDRSNTGKLVNKLANKGLIKIEIKTKNNKPVKILTLTDKGKKLQTEIIEKVLPFVEKIKSQITQEAINNIKKDLEEFKNIIKKTVKINI